MKVFLRLLLFTGLFLPGKNFAAQPKPQILNFGRFGKVLIYAPKKSFEKAVICFAGDGGWNKGIQDIAFKLYDDNTLLIAVNTKNFLHQMNIGKDKLLYPAADVEQLSQFIQKKLKFPTYEQPVLLGYSSGATLVYGLLAQAPQGTFKGGIVLGFCPDLAVARPLAKGSGDFECYKRSGHRAGYDIGACKELSAPMISLQGKQDEVCDYTSTYAFLSPIKKAQIITLPQVGHGYSFEKNWLPQFKTAYARIMLLEENNAEKFESGLPVKITSAKKEQGDLMAVMISGDGGWTGFDQEIATSFADKNIPVVGLNALKYFWSEKTPQQTAHDVTMLIEHYSAIWHKDKVILVGYSFGADVMPFVYNRLVPALRDKVQSVGLLSPSGSTDFEIHVSDLFSLGGDDRNYAVMPEIARMKNEHTVCFYGREEEGLPVKNIPKNSCKLVILEGGHHYDNSTNRIARELIL